VPNKGHVGVFTDHMLPFHSWKSKKYDKNFEQGIYH